MSIDIGYLPVNGRMSSSGGRLSGVGRVPRGGPPLTASKYLLTSGGSLGIAMKPRVVRLLQVTVPVLLVAGLGLVLRGWPVEAAGRRVEAGTVVDEVLGVGLLEGAREVRVAFEAPGRVTALAVDEGAMVQAGDLLGILDVSDAARDLAVVRSSEGAAEAAVERARAELERARLGAQRAAADRARADRLFEGGVTAASAHEAAVERDLSAQAEERALESALRQAEQGREGAARSRAIRSAQVADGQLMSPVTGLVVDRAVEAGQLVGAGTPAFTIVAIDTMHVAAWVDETALGRLAVGQPARVLFRSEGERAFAGTVSRIGREVDRQTHELQVEVTVHELPKNFAVGQRADAWIELGRREEVPSVPRGWCEQTCTVVEDGRVVSRTVTLGLVGRGAVEVVAGLAAGDMVLAPGARLGARVRVLEAP